MMRSLLLLGSAAAQIELGDVIVGTSANLPGILADFPAGVLVEFYAPWCGHCKSLEPKYKEAAEKLHADGVKAPLVKVDATVEEALGSEYKVNGYPTLKWFVGGSPADYDGPRDAAGIVEWVKGMTGPAVKEEACGDDVALCVTWTGASLETFEEVAKANRKKASWHWVKGGADKITMKHKHEEPLSLEVSDKEGMEAFFKQNRFPLFGNLDGDTFGTFMERGNGILWCLFDMTADNMKETIDAKRPEMLELAASLGSEFSVTWTDTVGFKKVLESMFGVTTFPKVIVQKKVGDKKNFIYDGEITKDAVADFVKKVQTGEVQAHLKSEEAPVEPQAEPVKVIVGKTLEEMVFTSDKDVMLEVYAPWCGHCKKLDPEYIKVAKKIAKEGVDDMITIAKIDGTQNDSPVDSISWSGFPTIYYVKAGSTSPEKYDGARDAKGIWKWIKKNHSQASLLRERIAKAAEGKKEEL